MELTMKVLKANEMKEALKTRTRSARPWKFDIVEFLVRKPEGATDVEIYNSTRPDRLDISDSKKVHNIASQLTYIAQDAVAVIEKRDDRRILVAISEDTAKLLQINAK